MQCNDHYNINTDGDHDNGNFKSDNDIFDDDTNCYYINHDVK